MTGIWIAVAAAAVLTALAVTVILRRRRASDARGRSAQAVIAEARSSTSLDGSTGAVRSVQSAESCCWTPTRSSRSGLPEYLERLARTYWRFLSRVTLGLIRVRYGENERAGALLFAPLQAAHLSSAGIRDGSRCAASCAGASRGGCWSPDAAATAAGICRSRCAATGSPDAATGAPAGSASRWPTSTRRSRRG